MDFVEFDPQMTQMFATDAINAASGYLSQPGGLVGVANALADLDDAALARLAQSVLDELSMRPGHPLAGIAPAF
jgi:hypothetical protein